MKTIKKAAGQTAASVKTRPNDPHTLSFAGVIKRAYIRYGAGCRLPYSLKGNAMFPKLQSSTSLSMSHTDGEQAAEQFIIDLTTHIAIGDDLYHLVSQHTSSLSPENDAFLRGLLRRIEKRLENLS